MYRNNLCQYRMHERFYVQLFLFYHNKDAHIAILDYAAKSITAAYSYDYTKSQLTNARAIANVITLAFYSGKMQEKRASIPWTIDLI